MPGLREEGEPADTPRFFELNEDDTPENEPAPAPSVSEATPAKAPNPLETQIPAPENSNNTSSTSRDTKKSKHLHQLRKYLRAVSIADDTPEDIKEDASKYILKEKELWEKEREIPVILDGDKGKEIIEAVHRDLGHYGKDTTVDAVKKRYLIPADLLKEGTETLDACVPCQLFKPPQKTKNTATIHPYGVKKTFGLWEIDFAGPFVKTSLGNQYLITTIEYMTAKALAYPLPQRSADAAVELLEEIVWTFGPPKEVISDNGTEFESHEFTAARKQYGIEHNKTSPGHPQTNGKVERLNSELITRLQHISVEPGNRRKDWDFYIRQALFAFSAHTNRQLGATPFYLQYGVEPVLPSTTSITESPLTRSERTEASTSQKRACQRP